MMHRGYVWEKKWQREFQNVGLVFKIIAGINLLAKRISLSLHLLHRRLAYITGRLFDVLVKTYRLFAPDGSTYESTEPGELGANCSDKIYRHLDC